MTNVWSVVTAIGTMITAIAAMVAAFIAMLTAHQAKVLAKFSAELQSVQYLDTTWQSNRMIKVRRGAAGALLRGEKSVDVEEILDFFDEIARLVIRDVLPIETAWNNYYLAIANYWVKCAAYAEEARCSEPALWTNLPKILTRLQQVEAKENDRPINAVSPLEAQAKEFLEGETNLELL
jgi:hypothetical protein